MYYFSYGSNMSSKRLKDRIQSAIVISKGKLPKHQLKFHKISKDGSSKCDILETQNNDDIVWGVLYEIDAKDLDKLDKVEGKGSGYERKEIEIVLDSSRVISAKTYYVKNQEKYTDSSLKPYDWYMMHLLYGAIENSLDIAYIQSIIKQPFITDNRVTKELEIYNM